MQRAYGQKKYLVVYLCTAAAIQIILLIISALRTATQKFARPGLLFVGTVIPVVSVTCVLFISGLVSLGSPNELLNRWGSVMPRHGTFKGVHFTPRVLSTRHPRVIL